MIKLEYSCVMLDAYHRVSRSVTDHLYIWAMLDAYHRVSRLVMVHLSQTSQSCYKLEY